MARIAEPNGDGVPYGIFELGESALLIWFAGGRAGQSLPFLAPLAVTLLQGLAPAPSDAVPAANSLLLMYERDAPDVGSVREYLSEVLPSVLRRDPPDCARHLLPVYYGGEVGPDLSEVAARHRVSESAIIRTHTSTEYRVAFLGFLPGFAYMGPVPLGVATARLASPRVRVPAGSVGVAGRYTGVYPFESPGGWNLIGRTPTMIWDPFDSQPARFAPGDTVRFAQTFDRPKMDFLTAPTRQVSYPLFEVETAGMLSLVQDQGRPGYAHIGVGRGGAADRMAAARANYLVGNPEAAAVIEVTWTGPSLRVLNSTVIALEGADLGCKVDGLAVPTGCGWFVRAGSTISFSQSSPSQSGARTFLAVAGGISVPAVLGSLSTSLTARFGGYGGRPLRPGDVLGSSHEPPQGNSHAGRFWLPKVETRLRGHATLRLIPYTGVGSAGKRALRGLLHEPWLVSSEASRVGIRLVAASGARLAGRQKGVTSFGVVNGTVQLPPGGNPLLLGVDAGTTGGYPVLGVVARCDEGIMAQLRPGDTVKFELTTVEAARAALGRALDDLRWGAARLNFWAT